MTFARLTIAALALSVTAGSAASADPAGGACRPRAVKYAASTEAAFRTNSNSYVDLPQARVAFRQGGAKPGCVLVRFSAAPKVTGFASMEFRATLDGVEGMPFEAQGSDGVDRGPTAHRFTFIFPSVEPGAHVVQMQYVSLSGVLVAMNAHNTIVWFTP
jgi:hypothetical protein